MRYYLLFFLIFLISCQTTRPFSNELPEPSMQDYSVAFEHLENGRYSQSVKGFSKLAEQFKDQEKNIMYWSILFNLGSSYEQLGQCKKAEETYQKLISIIEKDAHFEAQTLFRLHYIYDCIGQIERSLVFLKDAEKKSHKLNDISRWVEIPARYSILYTQLDQKDKSFDYQNRAFDGVKKIKSPIKDSRLLNEKGSQLFYIMGRSFSHPSYLQMGSYLKALPTHQVYLIQSILSSDSSWSQMAQKELFSIYENLWTAYEKIPKKDKPLYHNQIMEVLRDLQKLSKESTSSQFKKIQTQIVEKTLAQIKKSKKVSND